MLRPTRPLLVLPALLATALAGCRSFAPAPTTELAPGERVRVHLSQPRTVDMEAVVLRDVVELEGELVEWSADSVTVFAATLGTWRGDRQRIPGQLVRVPRRQVDGVETEQLLKGRTAAVAIIGAGVIGGLVYAVSQAGSDGGGGNGNGNGGGTSSMVAGPCCSIPILKVFVGGW